MKESADSSRRIAADIVFEWLSSDEFPDRLMESVARDRAFVMEMVYGCVRRHRTLDWLRSRFAPKQPSPKLDALLHIGLYQLWFMTDVQEYAAVNETVETAKRRLGPRQAGLVNAVLRRVQANRAALESELAKQSLGVRLSHPDSLVARWSARYGSDGALRLCEWNNGVPDVVLRANTRRTTQAELQKMLADAGVGAKPHPFAPNAFLVLSHGSSVTRLPGYAEGLFFVQDPSTSLAPAMLAPKAGERVLDACGAPGGKAMLMAEMMGGNGGLAVMDISGDRLAQVRENAERMGWDFIRIVRGDAAAGRIDGDEGLFDAILLDVPCSNTGVIRRRPDVRWRFSEDRLRKVCDLQRRILDAAPVLLSANGRICYSTCSIEPEENEQQIQQWLARNPGFRLADEKILFPPDAGVDGAYAALLSRQP